MSEHLRISVIIPAFNARETIRAALDSALGQTVAPHEVIVIDDGSTDDTAKTLATYRYRVRIMGQANAGPAAARNRGLELVTGEVMGFLDADDRFPPDALRVMSAGLQAHPETEIVQGYVQDDWTNEEKCVLSEPRLSFQLGSALFRRHVFDKVGGFLESLRRGEDSDFWLRTREHGIVHRVIPDVTYWYHRQPINALHDHQAHRTVLVRAVKRSLDRTRRISK